MLSRNHHTGRGRRGSSGGSMSRGLPRRGHAHLILMLGAIEREIPYKMAETTWQSKSKRQSRVGSWMQIKSFHISTNRDHWQFGYLGSGIVHRHVLAKTSQLHDTKSPEPPHEPHSSIVPPGSPTRVCNKVERDGDFSHCLLYKMV